MFAHLKKGIHGNVEEYICGVEDDATNVWKKCIKKSVAQNTADHVSYRILLCCTYCMCTPHGNLTR